METQNILFFLIFLGTDIFFGILVIRINPWFLKKPDVSSRALFRVAFEIPTGYGGDS